MSNDTLTLSDNKLSIPRAKRGTESLIINMAEIYSIEAKIPEIRRSTMATLPDLITDFTLGVLKITNIMFGLELELRHAKRLLDSAKAVAQLEKVETVLREKNVKSSADTREAAIGEDIDVKALREIVDQLSAVQSFLEGKHSAFKMSYDGAKKIFDGFIRTPNPSAYTGENIE